MRMTQAVVVVAMSMLAASAAMEAKTETLDEAWSAALATDPGLEASRAKALAARSGLASARAERLPSVKGQASYSVYDDPLAYGVVIPPIPGVLPDGASGGLELNEEEFGLADVRVTQPLYTFGRISRGVDAARAELAAAQAGGQGTVLDIKLEVAEAYIGVLQAQRLVEVSDSMVESLEAHTHDVDNMVRRGAGIRANLLAAQVAAANALQFQLEMNNALSVGRAAYNRALARPLDAPVDLQELPEPVDEYDLQNLTEQALSGRPELAQLSAKADALRSQAGSVGRANYPQLFVEVGASYIENEFLVDETYTHAAVLAEWNFFDSGRRRKQAKQLRHTAQAVSFTRQEIESLITLEVKKAWLDLDSTRKRVRVNRDALVNADENLRISRNRYRNGAGTNTEVLDAQTLRTETYSTYYRSVYDAVLAHMKLLRAAGTL